MLRDPSLIPLSHQHHNGLALCVLTRRSLAADSSQPNVIRQAQRVIDRYDLELVNHFQLEEDLLFPACGPLPIIDRLLLEHRMIEALVAQLREHPEAALLHQFCALLSEHIRLEEGELFEEAQRTIPRERLDDLGREIDRRAVRVCL